MQCELKLVSSLDKIFFDKFDALDTCESGSMLANEVYSFQLAVWGTGEPYPVQKCRLEIDSPLEEYIRVYQVGYVPSTVPALEPWDDDYITKTPGVLFPDPLFPVKDGKVDLFVGQARSLWFAVEPNGEKAGTFPITLRIFDEKDNLAGEACFTLDIIDAVLPELDIYNTSWFHGDCLAVLHGTEVQSETWWHIVEQYVRNYAAFGHNTILTPIFTPPLDTAVGGERPTNQLIEVTKDGDVYTFSFTPLKRWLQLCRDCGIKHYEISHLYTQWGAAHAPKVMATVDGEYHRLFGWETDALSSEYIAFLHALLPALIDFLKQAGVWENCLFHVSDEPNAEHETQYRRAKETLLKHLDTDKLIDALSDYRFFETGIVTRPVVSTDHLHTFLDHGVKGVWAYYCTGQGKDVANRFMAMPSYRNRVLGQQLYKYDIAGFLQWGYNFWFEAFSKGVVDPYRETSAGGRFQSGDAFVVYPMQHGEVINSLRLYVFREAMQDLRALKLLESLSDRETVMALLDGIDGFGNYPRNNAYFLKLRQTVNQRIQEQV